MSAEQIEKDKVNPGPETQSQRWAKYGSNVALMVVLAIVVAMLVTYIVQSHDVRIDTTAQGVNSLKPQTLNILRDLPTDVKIVSLYSRVQPSETPDENAPREVNKAALVSDLLDSYKRVSGHITTEVIDPDSERGKVDQLTTEIEQRYGKDIKNYQQFLADYDKLYPELAKLTTDEAEKVSALPADKIPDDKDGQLLQTALSDVQNKVPRMLSDNKSTITRMLKERHPDYKAITGGLDEFLKNLSRFEGGLAEVFPRFQSNAAVPQAIRDYIVGAVPRYMAVKKIADEQVAAIGKLGELKSDEVKRALNVPNPILILGPNEWRVLSESQVWPVNNSAKMYTDGKVAASFAGEQQISSAIVSLSSAKKPKIVFLRPGGPPVTAAGFPPFIPSGRFSTWADRLRESNFDVLDKDLSGQWAMQAMQQQMPTAPEPDWTAIADAVWVVLDFGGQMAGGPEPIAPKLAEHLGHGGSAIILVGPQSDNLSTVVKDWGVDIHSEALAVHRQPPPPPNNGGQIDPFQEALRRAWFWGLKDYGTADLAKPLKSLESIFAPVVVIRSHEVEGYTTKTLLPLPTAPEAQESWGETDFNSLEAGNTPTYDPKTDLPAPLVAGVTVEKKGGGRLVVIGAATFAQNDYLNIPDPEIARTERKIVARFPGNGELATNAAFWAARMDSMIALSPAALQVSRIADMSPTVLNFWRVGVLLVLLPLAVLACGMGVYFSRRD